MRMTDYTDAIRKSVTARQAAEALGLQPNRGNFCRCPIHGEKTASMKLYPKDRGWYCFGCHTGGSVIDLVMVCNGVDLKGAVAFLNDQFRLGLPIDTKATAEQEAQAKRLAEEREARRRRQAEQEKVQGEAFERWCDLGVELAQAERDITDYAPTDPEAEWDMWFCHALRRAEIIREEAAELELNFLQKEVS